MRRPSYYIVFSKWLFYSNQGFTLEIRLHLLMILSRILLLLLSIYPFYFSFFSSQLVKPRSTIYSNYAAFTITAFHWTQVHQLYYSEVDHWFRSVQYKWHKQPDWWLCSWLGLKKCRNKLCIYGMLHRLCSAYSVVSNNLYIFFNLDRYGK